MGARNEESALTGFNSAGEELVCPPITSLKQRNLSICHALSIQCNRFILRAKTSLSQKLHVDVPAGHEGKMTSYLQKERKNGRFPDALIGNMSILYQERLLIELV